MTFVRPPMNDSGPMLMKRSKKQATVRQKLLSREILDTLE